MFRECGADEVFPKPADFAQLVPLLLAHMAAQHAAL